MTNTPVSSTTGVTGTDIALSADGHTLYLNMAKVDGVGEFAVHGGTVTQLPGSPVQRRIVRPEPTGQRKWARPKG